VATRTIKALLLCAQLRLRLRHLGLGPVEGLIQRVAAEHGLRQAHSRRGARVGVAESQWTCGRKRFTFAVPPADRFGSKQDPREGLEPPAPRRETERASRIRASFTNGLLVDLEAGCRPAKLGRRRAGRRRRSSDFFMAEPMSNGITSITLKH